MKAVNKLIVFGFKFYILLFLFTSSCCEKDCLKPGDIMVSKGIESNWQWQYSESGWGKMNPVSEGYNQYLVFDDLYYTEFINDSIVKYLQYDVEVRPDTMYGTDKFLVLQNGQEYSYSFIGKDTLRLYELCFDCPFHQFRRL